MTPWKRFRSASLVLVSTAAEEGNISQVHRCDWKRAMSHRVNPLHRRPRSPLGRASPLEAHPSREPPLLCVFLFSRPRHEVSSITAPPNRNVPSRLPDVGAGVLCSEVALLSPASSSCAPSSSFPALVPSTSISSSSSSASCCFAFPFPLPLLGAVNNIVRLVASKEKTESHLLLSIPWPHHQHETDGDFVLTLASLLDLC